MDDLVNEITRRVLEALHSRGLAAAQPAEAPAPANAPANSPAPASTAAPTFAAMARSAASPGPATVISAAQQATGKRETPPPAAKVFITADMLLRRLETEGGNGRTLELAHNEYLTPAAEDVVDQRHLTVKKLPQPLPAPPETNDGGNGQPPAAACATGACETPRPTGGMGLVIERPSEAVRGVLAGLAHDRMAVVDYTQTDCWIANTRLLCGAVLDGTVSAGAVILPYAADAMVLANKIDGIRAVQGTRTDSVAGAIRHFAPNVLVLEHAFSTFHEMRAMLRAFAAPRALRPAATVLMDNLENLENG